MKQDDHNVGLPEDMNVRLTRAAHHEAGHIVVAAAKELRLRPEGLSVDPCADGLACYCTQPDGTALSLKSIIVATLSGFYAERRFCDERGYLSVSPEEWFLHSTDGREARTLLSGIQIEHLSKGNVAATHCELERESEQLVEQYWPAIKELAAALLAKDWEPLKPLKSGSTWCHSTTAKYLTGDEAVEILGRFGIAALCDSHC